MEFFCSPENFAKLEARLKKRRGITYMAVNSQEDLRSNIGASDVNAVTWGVFPAKEVVQPTVVDPQSFSVWKVCRPIEEQEGGALACIMAGKYCTRCFNKCC